ncbi:hypothetical protein GCM10017567_35320 [Amycolatopsis bullii]|uniref:Uncharacterized protein n=1 Tax=Amycolatopsis bullii TaxID=941987 RepID=A0ABQ3KEB2_9PSEU|nr:hypothetical protein GCM10017567_35320 [Amycolatopsis bullii]
MVYDDDRDNPLTERVRASDRRWPWSKETAQASGTPQASSNRVYRCTGVTEDGTRCKRTKRGEPGFVCHDHLKQTGKRRHRARR